MPPTAPTPVPAAVRLKHATDGLRKNRHTHGHISGLTPRNQQRWPLSTQ
jgi:hypothetical protein